jgi:hypothetical protein
MAAGRLGPLSGLLVPPAPAGLPPFATICRFLPKPALTLLASSALIWLRA